MNLLVSLREVSYASKSLKPIDFLIFFESLLQVIVTVPR